MKSKLVKFSLVFVGYALPALCLADMPLPGSGSTGTTIPNPLNGNVRSITDLITLILNNIIFPVGAVVIVIMIIYSGFLFVTARGNESKIEDARRNFLYVVIGAAILLGAVVISNIISGTVCQIATGIPGCPTPRP